MKAGNTPVSDILAATNNIGHTFLQRQQPRQALRYFNDALKLSEGDPKATGVRGIVLGNIAAVHDQLREFEQADAAHRNSIATLRETLGPQHISVARALRFYARHLKDRGRFDGSAELYRESLSITDNVVDPLHPDRSYVHFDMAELFQSTGKLEVAAAHFEAAVDMLVRRIGLYGSSDDPDARLDAEGLRRRLGRYARRTIDVMSLIFEENPAQGAALANRTFVLAQWAALSSTATAISRMASRAAVKKPEIDADRRRRDALVRRRQEIEAQRLNQLAQSGAAVPSVELASIDTQIADIDDRLRKIDPDLARLAVPAPTLSLDVQAALAADEALVLILPSEDGVAASQSYIWVVSRQGIVWSSIPLTATLMGSAGRLLRCGLDPAAWNDQATAEYCAQELQQRPVIETVNGMSTRILPFSPAVAHIVYRGLFGGAEAVLQGKRLVVVPTGIAMSLPLNVLVTKPSDRRAVVDLSVFRTLDWMGTRQPITVLPSVESLITLRGRAGKSGAAYPYLGLANPLLLGDSENPDPSVVEAERRRAREAAQIESCEAAQPRSMGRRVVDALYKFKSLFVRSGGVSPTQIKRLPPLPETAGEVCRVAESFGGDAKDRVLLGSRFTEANIKSLSGAGHLKGFRMLHFATHAALPGEIPGNAEPGLVLTPPVIATSDDDGYLSSSEIMGLSIDADWVLLSACNTAGAQDPGQDALSGLARSFFYAGARALLVSHWVVDSDATVRLVTEIFRQPRRGAVEDRSSALLRAMSQMINATDSRLSHPSNWGPFFVAGQS